VLETAQTPVCAHPRVYALLASRVTLAALIHSVQTQLLVLRSATSLRTNGQSSRGAFGPFFFVRRHLVKRSATELQSAGDFTSERVDMRISKLSIYPIKSGPALA